MAAELLILIGFVYAIVESLEKLGLSRRIAHLLAIPLGILSSFGLLQCASILECFAKGLLIGICAVGTCDTACNILAKFKDTNK